MIDEPIMIPQKSCFYRSNSGHALYALFHILRIFDSYPKTNGKVYFVVMKKMFPFCRYIFELFFDFDTSLYELIELGEDTLYQF
ncbi:hypothetical protein EBS02_08485 [bacterium]|nr:hypothetical protein [bacterium]